jgi:tetratricopeptide (TPR) repeat protein
VIWGNVRVAGNGVEVKFQLLQSPGQLDNPAFPQLLPMSPHRVAGRMDIPTVDSVQIMQFAEAQSLAIAAFSLGLYHISIPDYWLAAGQFGDAADKLEGMQVASGGTDLGLVLFYLARSHVQMAWYDEAMADVTKALTYRPDEPALYIISAYIHRVRQDTEAQKTDLDRALRLISAHLSSETQTADLHNRGLIFEARNDLEAALDEFTKLYTEHPDFFSAYLSAGRVLVRLKRFDAADAIYKRAALLAQDNPARLLWLNLGQGRLFEEQGQLSAAIQHYQTAVQLNPALATSYYALANAYAKDGVYDAAILAYEKFITVSHRSSWAYSEYGDFLFAQNDYAGAIKAYQQALSSQPYQDDQILLRAKLAQSFAAEGDLEQAVAFFEQALVEPSVHTAYIHNLFAYVLDRAKQPEAALREYEAAIGEYELTLARKQGLGYDTRLRLAALYLRVDRPADARAHYTYLMAHQSELNSEQRNEVQDRLDSLPETGTPVPADSLSPEAP